VVVTETPASARPVPNPELIDLIARHTPGNGLHDTAVPGLHLYRSPTTAEPIHTVYRPSFCLVAQGSKTLSVGQRELRYGPAQFVLVAVNTPVAVHLLEASPEYPHLALHVDLDLSTVAGLIPPERRDDRAQAAAAASGAGVRVATMDERLHDVVLRLVRLLDHSADIPVLAPLVERELSYLLLNGPDGAALRAMALTTGPSSRIARAVERLERGYREPLRVEQLAREAHMSVSTFHHHFKAVTAISPLQFQKRLRLYEARRLLIAHETDVTGASTAVGYSSLSQFSREYRTMFGSSPSKDLALLRAGTDPH
jgi:AraC-like DNA-binding protein